MFEDQKKFAKKHLYLTNANHLAGGFGLAIVLQHYIAGNVFLPVSLGWILVAFMAAVHIYEFTR